MVNGPKVVKTLGIAWIVAAVTLIFVGLAGVAMSEGFMVLLDLLSPFNIISYAAIAITLLPGVLAVTWANKKLEA